MIWYQFQRNMDVKTFTVSNDISMRMAQIWNNNKQSHIRHFKCRKWSGWEQLRDWSRTVEYGDVLLSRHCLNFSGWWYTDISSVGRWSDQRRGGNSHYRTQGSAINAVAGAVCALGEENRKWKCSIEYCLTLAGSWYRCVVGGAGGGGGATSGAARGATVAPGEVPSVL